MDAEPKRFLVSWLVAVVTITAALALLNGLVDPYLVFGVPRASGFNSIKPAADTQQYLIKPYDAVRTEPHTIVLGSSRVDIGMDTRSRAWPVEDRPIYNLGLPAGGPYAQYRYLQHVMAQHHVSLVVLGLEFESFVVGSPPPLPKFESRLSVTRDGSQNRAQGPQRYQDFLTAALSFDALIDSAATLSANVIGGSSDLVDGRWESRFLRRTTEMLGSGPLIAINDWTYSQIYRRGQTDMSLLNVVRAILDLCRANGVRVIAFINPSHADELELLDVSGRWSELEAWKRALTLIVAEYPATDPGRFELWDFCGYDAYSSESLSAGQRTLRWFFNISHYKTTLGDVILRQIFGEENTGLGVRVTPANIESHLAEVRRQQRRYRETHPNEVQRAQKIFNRGAGDAVS